MSEEFIECAFTGGLRWPVKRYPSRAERFAVTESTYDFRHYSIAHIASGKRCGGDLAKRQAEIFSVVLDHILLGETEAEVLACWSTLPKEVRRWVREVIGYPKSAEKEGRT